MKAADAVLAGVVLVLVVAGLVSRNGLVRQRSRVREAWAQLDVQLDRRHRLVPLWVATIQGAQAHERAVLERVARAAEQAHAVRIGPARSGLATLGRLELELTSALDGLQQFAEANPQLRTGENSLRLHEDLLSAENRVAFAKQHFNDSAMLYNTAVQAFPRSIVARLCGLRRAEYLELSLLTDT